MPSRALEFQSGHYYHVFNHASHSLTPFATAQYAEEFLKALNYYTQTAPRARLSQRDRLSKAKSLPDYTHRLVNLISYVIMPDHFHLILQQLEEDGVATYLRRLQNSFARLYNARSGNRGPLFEGNFRAVELTNQEELLYLSRYLHLHPVEAKLTTKPTTYPYSSLRLFTHSPFSPPHNPSPLLEPYLSPNDYLIYVTSTDLTSPIPANILPKLLDHAKP